MFRFGFLAAASAFLLAMSAFAQSSPKIPSTTRQYGDWTLTCRQLPDQTDCGAAYDVAAANGAGVAFQAVAFYDFKVRRPKLLFVVPGDAASDQPFGLLIDGTTELLMPFVGCDARSCAAAVDLPPHILRKFSEGEKARAAWRLASSGEEAGVNVSLRGFGDAMKAMLAETQ